MIISRTPLRITFGGGGTDLPSFYENTEDGFVISAAIDKYIYISIHENFNRKILLKYSEIEETDKVSNIRHPIIREALLETNLNLPIEISSLADIPAGTGLGSSGSFTVGLLKSIYEFRNMKIDNNEIAAQACRIEIDRIGAPVGKQDQYISALGGIKTMEFQKSGDVLIKNVDISHSMCKKLEDNLKLFYTGIKRSSHEELRPIMEMSSKKLNPFSENLVSIKQSGIRSSEHIRNGNFEALAKELTLQWKLKFERNPSLLNTQIDKLIELGLSSGALGGKLIGAGGGGFLLFYSEYSNKLSAAMKSVGLLEVPFKFDFRGSSIVTS